MGRGGTGGRQEAVRMARSLGSHAGPSHPKECAVRLAISTPSLRRTSQEMEVCA